MGIKASDPPCKVDFFKVVVAVVCYAGCLSMMKHTPALTTPGAEVDRK